MHIVEPESGALSPNFRSGGSIPPYPPAPTPMVQCTDVSELRLLNFGKVGYSPSGANVPRPWSEVLSTPTTAGRRCCVDWKRSVAKTNRQLPGRKARGRAMWFRGGSWKNDADVVEPRLMEVEIACRRRVRSAIESPSDGSIRTRRLDLPD